MDPLPLLQELDTPLDDFGEQSAHFRPVYADARYNFRFPAMSKQVDFGVSVSCDVNVRWPVIASINHKPIVVSSVNDDHFFKLTRLLGLSSPNMKGTLVLAEMY